MTPATETSVKRWGSSYGEFLIFFTMGFSVLHLNQLFLARRRVYHKLAKADAAAQNMHYSDMPWLSERWWRGRQCYMGEWLHVFLRNGKTHTNSAVGVCCALSLGRAVSCSRTPGSLNSARSDVDSEAECLTQKLEQKLRGWYAEWPSTLLQVGFHVVTGGLGSISRSVSSLCTVMAEVCNITMLHFRVLVNVSVSEKNWDLSSALVSLTDSVIPPGKCREESVNATIWKHGLGECLWQFTHIPTGGTQ